MNEYGNFEKKVINETKSMMTMFTDKWSLKMILVMYLILMSLIYQ